MSLTQHPPIPQLNKLSKHWKKRGHRNGPYNCHGDFCLSSEAMLTMTVNIVHILQWSKQCTLSSVAWDFIIKQIGEHQTPENVSEIFKTFMQFGKPEQIKTFCTQGWDPFVKPHTGTDPPIFGLMHCMNNLDAEAVFTAIFDGMKEYHMKHLSTLMQGRDKDDMIYYDEYEWPDNENRDGTKKTFLQAALNRGNKMLSHYIMDHSPVHKHANDVVRTETFPWTFLHEAIVQGDKIGMSKSVEPGYNLGGEMCYR